MIFPILFASLRKIGQKIILSQKFSSTLLHPINKCQLSPPSPSFLGHFRDFRQLNMKFDVLSKTFYKRRIKNSLLSFFSEIKYADIQNLFSSHFSHLKLLFKVDQNKRNERICKKCHFLTNVLSTNNPLIPKFLTAKGTHFLCENFYSSRAFFPTSGITVTLFTCQ